MIVILKFLFFLALSFVALVGVVNADEALVTITFKDSGDCPTVGDETLKAFLNYYSVCAYEHLGGTDGDDGDNGDNGNGDGDDGDRQLLRCNNCIPFCNCYGNYRKRFSCGIHYPHCSLCDCQRRNLDDPFSDHITLEGNEVEEEIFEEVVIAEGSRSLKHEEYGNDLWECACNALEQNGIDGNILRDCPIRSVQTWTNMV